MSHNNLPTPHTSQNIDWDAFQSHITLELHRTKKECNGAALVNISKYFGLQYKNKCFYDQKTWIFMSQESSQELISLIKNQIKSYHWDYIKCIHMKVHGNSYLLITRAQTNQLLRKILANTEIILTKDEEQELTKRFRNKYSNLLEDE